MELSLLLYFLLHAFGISQAILRALGLKWRHAVITCFCIWVLTLPTVTYFSMIRGGGLVALWTVLQISYKLMQAALVMGYTSVNWKKHSMSMQEAMNHRTRMHADEETALL